MDELVERAASLNIKLDGKRHSGHAQVYQKFLLL